MAFNILVFYKGVSPDGISTESPVIAENAKKKQAVKTGFNRKHLFV
jgi:hypothetical protein